MSVTPGRSLRPLGAIRSAWSSRANWTRGVVLAVVVGGASLASAGTAEAVEVQFCNQTAWFAQLCPNDTSSSHPRHTYTQGEARWDGCLASGLGYYRAYVAFANSIASSPKYEATDTCTVAGVYHPANTETLRPYALHSTGVPGSGLFMRGKAWY